MSARGYFIVPFSRDELVKRQHLCRQTVYELLGRLSGVEKLQLTVYEKEAIRYILKLNRPFRVKDICGHLHVQRHRTVKILQALVEKGLIQPYREGRVRHHEYMMNPSASGALFESLR